MQTSGISGKIHTLAELDKCTVCSPKIMQGSHIGIVQTPNTYSIAPQHKRPINHTQGDLKTRT